MVVVDVVDVARLAAGDVERALLEARVLEQLGTVLAAHDDHAALGREAVLAGTYGTALYG